MAKVTFAGIGIQNLGPFRHRQYLDLQVRSGRPIVLVKALNGAGKTTLLTSLQVVLYGSKALGAGRNAEYDQLMRGLHRQDARETARIDLDLRVEANGQVDEFTISREWTSAGGKLAEELSVSRLGTKDFQLTEEWDEYLDSILPAELAQLFLFDGERIESLASPKTLPEMLRRATEAFLGIGGIDVLSKDLIAVERRALMRAKGTTNEYEHAQGELLEFERQHAAVSESISFLTQSAGSARQAAERARTEYERFSNEARRAGLSAFEHASEIRALEQRAHIQVAEAEAAVRESLADPIAPLAGLGGLWDRYKCLWSEERQGKAAKHLLEEVERRDKRIVAALHKEVPLSALRRLKEILAQDSLRYKAASERILHLVESEDPAFLEPRIREAASRYQTSKGKLERTRSQLIELQRKVTEIPQGEQLSELLAKLQEFASRQSAAESKLAGIDQELSDKLSTRAYLETRLNAARLRMSKDFRGQVQESKAIEAGQRARSVLAIFKDQLLASKAAWLSDMITIEFRGLMRKQRLITKVQVDPTSYAVSIVGSNGHELPMDRLSAGERQLLAIAVLSALIRERKGRFPVVVDTPLARLDRTHRQALIRRFFAKVSHQVVVLSTDEEVEGAVFDEMLPFISSAYLLEFSDEERSTSAGPLKALVEA